MERIAYGVARHTKSKSYSFDVLHESLDEAVKEAERLTAKEGAKFLIFKLVGIVELDQRPIKKEIWD